MHEKPLPKRSEIPDAYRWRLEDIYLTPEAWEQDAEKLRQRLSEAERFKGKLGSSASTLAEALEFRDEISRLTEKLFVYARMRRDEDNAETTSQARADKAETLITQVQTAFSYYVPELLTVPENMLRQYLEQEPRLANYRHHLEEVISKREHILTEAEERILSELGEVLTAADTAFTMLNNADIKFRPVHNGQGDTIELSKGRYGQFIEGTDGTLRRESFNSLHDAYGELRNTIASTLTGAVKRDVVSARLRHYPSALEASLDQDNVSLKVYEELIAAVHRYLPQLHRYFALKKKALNFDELHIYDLYTPMVPEARMTVEYEEAKVAVCRGVEPLGETYERMLNQGLNGGWVDVYENQNKTSGAYAWGCYDSHPYVLLNHQPNLSSLLTLAHEMGHAMHSALSNAHQPYVNAEYRIILAEVASTVNEVLVLRDLLKRTEDRNVRRYLLNRFLEEFRTTVFRQTMFAEFEWEIHRTVESGEALTAEYLSEVYMRLNQEYHGPDVVLDEGLAVEWSRIPHFYNGFYVYKYATGFSSAVALAQGILTEGEPAVERYLTFLKSGNSDYPLELLRRAGVDLTTAEPVNAALDYFVQLLNQLEQEFQ